MYIAYIFARNRHKTDKLLVVHVVLYIRIAGIRPLIRISPCLWLICQRKTKERITFFSNDHYRLVIAEHMTAWEYLSFDLLRGYFCVVQNDFRAESIE